MRGVVAAVLKRMNTGIPFSRFTTVSAGNMAQAVAAVARDLGMPAIAVVPDSAPQVKIDAIKALGAEIDRRPMAEVWELVENPTSKKDELLIHPLATPGILAGYGTIALELLEQVPDCDAVYIPFGVGGLTLGIATVLKLIAPHIRVICVETAAAPTLTTAILNGTSTFIPKGKTCVDAIGTPRVVPQALKFLEMVVDDTNVVSEVDVRTAVKLLFEYEQITVEGAAAAGFAAASSVSKFKNPVVIMTGQNINREVFADIVGKMA